MVHAQLGRIAPRDRGVISEIVGCLKIESGRHHPRKRMIQYSEAPAIEPKSCGVLDTPLEPVIGLAEGETRWRGMTALCGAAR
jgi:hypothetical protein